MPHVHAPRISARLCTLFGGAALLLLPGCPGDETPIDDTSSTSSSDSTTSPLTIAPDDTTTLVPPCEETGGCGDTTVTPTDSSTGTTDATGTGTTGSSTDTGSTGSSSSSGGESSSGTTMGVSATEGSSTDTGIIFLMEPDLPAAECDPYLQNCPAGEKCNPYASSGGSSWDALGCFPVDAAPVGVGDTCVVDGSGTSGVDNCEVGAMCWDVDAATNQGTCVAQCTGSPMAPVCPGGGSCTIANSGVLNLCLPGCDPLAQDCPGVQGCYPVGDAMICAPDASGAAGFDDDPCEFINVCDPGLMCIDGLSVENCPPGVGGCCTPFCDVTAPVDPCPAATEECVAFFAAGMAPIGLEDVGVCVIN